MVKATLADLIGGEMLFPGSTSIRKDREQRIAHMRRLFDEAIAAMRANNYVEAKACLDGLRLVYDVSVSVYNEKAAQSEKEG